MNPCVRRWHDGVALYLLVCLCAAAPLVSPELGAFGLGVLGVLYGGSLRGVRRRV